MAGSPRIFGAGSAGTPQTIQAAGGMGEPQLFGASAGGRPQLFESGPAPVLFDEMPGTFDETPGTFDEAELPT